MSSNTPIQWTDKSWGITLGCDKKSDGCKLCYAIKTAWRLSHNPNPKIGPLYQGLVEKTKGGNLNWTGLVRCVPERLVDPLHWKKPQRIFVNSQSDLFHEDVPFEFVDRVFAVMSLCSQHTFQILTKRPERMLEYFSDENRDAKYTKVAWQMWNEDNTISNGISPRFPLPNVWLGVSVENQETADERVPALLGVPAAIRFLSCEPLLGPVRLDALKCGELFDVEGAPYYNALRGFSFWGDGDSGHRGPQIHQVICGGESGPKARPMALEWARDLRDQCRQATSRQATGAGRRTAFFMKQVGPCPTFVVNEETAHCPLPPDKERIKMLSGRTGHSGYCLHEWRPRDPHGGDWDEWPEDLKVREFPQAEVEAEVAA